MPTWSSARRATRTGRSHCRYWTWISTRGKKVYSFTSSGGSKIALITSCWRPDDVCSMVCIVLVADWIVATHSWPYSIRMNRNEHGKLSNVLHVVYKLLRPKFRYKGKECWHDISYINQYMRVHWGLSTVTPAPPPGTQRSRVLPGQGRCWQRPQWPDWGTWCGRTPTPPPHTSPQTWPRWWQVVGCTERWRNQGTRQCRQGPTTSTITAC